MKKIIVASALALGLMSNVASANTGEVQFIGAVTDQTCNIYPEVDGVIKSTIDLGTMKPDGSGTKEVNFRLIPDPSEADCLTKTHASVGWQSAGFNSAGLINMKGDATGVAIELTALGTAKGEQKITFNSQNAEYGSASGTDKLTEFAFKTKLVKSGTANATAGTVISSASYAVAYK
ncbi:fimbrial protein [Salmonella enterica subsp. enterica serovar Typhimurium]|nr:fimbrial protein [Salmonella enterica subsp. enterica serovar Typhimurium]